jgi:hypothetical protein
MDNHVFEKDSKMAETKHTKKASQMTSEELAKFAEKKRKEAQERDANQEKNAIKVEKKVSLPVWPESMRGVPNSILRSALFGAVKRGKRAFLQRQEVASYENITILQTGPRLDQSDLDVWEQCLHLARNALGTRIQFPAYGFLKAIGRSTGGKDVEWLKDALARLASTVVEIKDGKKAYFGPTLHHGARDDESGHYVIEINPAIFSLYGSDGWSQIEWEERLSLKGHPLAQWLHGFYTTHAAPYPIKVETLHRLCGSENKELKGFRRELREALAKLEAVTGWGWEIDDADLVHIKKKPTASQVRHIQKRISKRTG